MKSAGRSNISSIFQHGLQDGYVSLNPHVKGGLFPLMGRELRRVITLLAFPRVNIICNKASSNMLTAVAVAPAVKPPAPAVESKLWHCGAKQCPHIC